jgi:hypothetical protein
MFVKTDVGWVLGAFLTLERVNLNVPRPEFDTPLIVTDNVLPVTEQVIEENPLSAVHPV